MIVFPLFEIIASLNIFFRLENSVAQVNSRRLNANSFCYPFVTSIFTITVSAVTQMLK